MRKCHYFKLGQESARKGNHWLSSVPFRGWRGEAWKDGMWSIHYAKEIK